MALASFSIITVQRALSSEIHMNPVPFALAPLLFILAVVVGTAYATGGIHLGSLGSDSLGGRKYLYLIAAILGFVAMTSLRIPEKKAGFYVAAYFLGGLTNIAAHLVHYCGSWLSFLLVVFPSQVGSSFLDAPNLTRIDMGRDYGLTATCTAGFFFMLARYGLKNIFQGGVIKKTFALVLFVGCMMGGFRSFLILILMTCFFMFWLQGLFRTKFVIVPLAILLFGLTLAPFAIHLPFPIQRSMSVLPGVKVAPEVLLDAQSTSGWRLQLWKTTLAEVPRYFWLGKGCESDTKEFVSTVGFQNQGLGGGDEAQQMSGDFHNGPLSILIPFGIWGMIGWLWFLVTSLRVLYLNHRHGPAALQSVNTLLLSLFIARIILFFFVFGGFYGDLCVFAGLVALSICLNGGVRRAIPSPVTKPKTVPRSIKITGRLAPDIR